jgi:hypothetical protein
LIVIAPRQRAVGATPPVAVAERIGKKDADARDKRGHDDRGEIRSHRNGLVASCSRRNVSAHGLGYCRQQVVSKDHQQL